MINWIIYLGYDGYRIHKVTKNIRKNLLQRENITQIEGKILILARNNIKEIEDFLKYAEQITSLQVFSVIFFSTEHFKTS